MTSLLILAISFTATLLSSMSGAGSALITVPVWLVLGYSLPVAQTASKVNGAVWTPIAAWNYLRSRDVDWSLLAGLAACGLLGAYLGSIFFVSVESQLLQRIIGGVILCLVAFAVIHKEFGVEVQVPAASRVLTSLLAIPLGFYEAFFGSGNGIFTSSLLAKTRGCDLVLALGYYYCISFVWCLFSAVLFLQWGFGDIGLIIPSTLGGVAGAHLGSLIGQRKGAKFIKYLFVGLGGLLGLKLLLKV
jgi:uncharacterized protein